MHTVHPKLRPSQANRFQTVLVPLHHFSVKKSDPLTNRDPVITKLNCLTLTSAHPLMTNLDKHRLAIHYPLSAPLSAAIWRPPCRRDYACGHFIPPDFGGHDTAGLYHLTPAWFGNPNTTEVLQLFVSSPRWGPYMAKSIAPQTHLPLPTACLTNKHHRTRSHKVAPKWAPSNDGPGPSTRLLAVTPHKIQTM